jgi:Na+/phosphate symporter
MNNYLYTMAGLIVFYVGLKMFSGGMKNMGNIDHLSWFLGNPLYMFFGSIVMTLAWQSSSLSTTAIIALVASNALPLPAAVAAIL